jgi:hypothetical protein
MRVNTSHNGPCELSVNKRGKCFPSTRTAKTNQVGRAWIVEWSWHPARPCDTWTGKSRRNSVHSWILIILFRLIRSTAESFSSALFSSNNEYIIRDRRAPN